MRWGLLLDGSSELALPMGASNGYHNRRRPCDHRPRRQAPRTGHAGARRARRRVLERLVAARGWPDRLTIALEQRLFDGTDRAR